MMLYSLEPVTGNDSKDISKKAYEVTRKFVDTGRGVLFGHDTVCLNNNNTYYAKFAEDLGIKVIADSRVYPGNRERNCGSG